MGTGVQFVSAQRLRRLLSLPLVQPLGEILTKPTPRRPQTSPTSGCGALGPERRHLQGRWELPCTARLEGPEGGAKVIPRPRGKASGPSLATAGGFLGVICWRPRSSVSQLLAKQL